MKKSNTQFIPAQESRWFILLFDWYVRSLFWRRFENVWVNQDYYPNPNRKTIYYLNHTSWWDGLIPLLLNRKLFRQNARAIMEDKQMKEYRFFKRIGAFSVNLHNPHSAIRSLRYAVESIQRPNSSLYIYPEGKIVPFSTQKPDFKKGLAWIASQCPDADVVPIGIYMYTVGSDKPELFMKIGSASEFDSSENPENLKSFFEAEMSDLLMDLQKSAHFEREQFQKL